MISWEAVKFIMGNKEQRRLKNEKRFLELGKKIHNDKYDYSQVNYKDSKTKVIIKCKDCGTVFLQTPVSHLQGHGCPKCAQEIINKKASKIDWESKKNELQNLIMSGKTFTEIGQYFGVSGHQVGIIAKRYGFKKLGNINKIEKLRKEITIDKIPLSELAKKYNCTYQAIFYLAKQYNIDIPSKETISYKDIPKDELVSFLYREKSIADISKIYNTSQDIIRNSIRYHKINLSKIKHDINLKISISISELISKGFTNNKISKELSISFWRVKEIEKEFDLVPNPSGHNNYVKEDLERYLIEEKLTYWEISAKYYNGVHPDSIFHAAKRFGINVPESTNKYSRGESFVLQYFEDSNIKSFSSHVKISKISGRNKHFVEIDFILEIDNLEYWIEYNGRQHYEFSDDFFHGNIENFLKQKERDQNVRDYCKENNIHLIEIPYIYDTYRKIKEFLDKVILQGIDPNKLIDYKSLYKN